MTAVYTLGPYLHYPFGFGSKLSASSGAAQVLIAGCFLLGKSWNVFDPAAHYRARRDERRVRRRVLLSSIFDTGLREKSKQILAVCEDDTEPVPAAHLREVNAAKCKPCKQHDSSFCEGPMLHFP